MDALSIRWLRVALANLDDIATYIAKDDPDAAYRVVSRVQEAASRLPYHPDLGRTGRVEGTRELIIAGTPYTVVYKRGDREIVVLRVFHGAREWPDRF